MIRKIGKVIEWIFLTISVLTIIWFILSFFNVVLHNLDENPQYWSYNIFIVFERIFL